MRAFKLTFYLFYLLIVVLAIHQAASSDADKARKNEKKIPEGPFSFPDINIYDDYSAICDDYEDDRHIPVYQKKKKDNEKFVDVDANIEKPIADIIHEYRLKESSRNDPYVGKFMDDMLRDWNNKGLSVDFQHIDKETLESLKPFSAEMRRYFNTLNQEATATQLQALKDIKPKLDGILESFEKLTSYLLESNPMNVGTHSTFFFMFKDDITAKVIKRYKLAKEIAEYEIAHWHELSHLHGLTRLSFILLELHGIEKKSTKQPTS